MTDERSSSPDYPDAQPVGRHLVIDVAEWVPGRDPEPHRRREEQSEYLESYYRCLLCGAERLRTDEFPEECDAPGPEVRATEDANASPPESGTSGR